MIDPRRDPRREVDIHDTLRQFRQVSHVSSSLSLSLSFSSSPSLFLSALISRSRDSRGRRVGSRNVDKESDVRPAVLVARLGEGPNNGRVVNVRRETPRVIPLHPLRFVSFRFVSRRRGGGGRRGRRG